MSLVFNQEAINGILFTLHFYNELPTVAHQKLMQMVGEEVMDMDQVTEFFKKIDDGEFRLKKDIKTLAQVVNVPNFVEKYVDLDTRLRLRKTSPTIREIINGKMLEIDWLHFKCNGLFFEISTSEDFKVTYEIVEGGLQVTNGDSEKFFSARREEEQIKIIQRDLMSILCSEKLRINTLRIRNDDSSTSDDDVKPTTAMTILRNTLNQVPKKLKISKLEFWVDELDDVFIETLKNIDSEHLESLDLLFGYFHSNLTPVWNDLHNLEEWKRLKSIVAGHTKFVVSETIRLYSHVQNARFAIEHFDYTSDNMSIHNSIMELKDKLLQNPNLKQFKMKSLYAMSDSDFENLKASLQQFNTSNTPYPCWITIPYPDSDKKLELLVEKKMIWFKGPCYVEGEGEEVIDDKDEEKRTVERMIMEMRRRLTKKTKRMIRCKRLRCSCCSAETNQKK
ncbi:hypothetical protein GCK72_011413 [Caenorhabditis remanei]|uniref:DUF38 domain-containing protein n=1 Tax=Caenorhabditis remanei TaxID=31234 RepID=A0A6A5H7H7_CAERE|nr:hypothetical protein GCK72_011413 [Caenorhabditis remanei]KAF1763147.1 hypothetical protein GCK72_011413 [Caenorhabditis remanei]